MTHLDVQPGQCYGRSLVIAGALQVGAQQFDYSPGSLHRRKAALARFGLRVAVDRLVQLRSGGHAYDGYSHQDDDLSNDSSLHILNTSQEQILQDECRPSTPSQLIALTVVRSLTLHLAVPLMCPRT